MSDDHQFNEPEHEGFRLAIEDALRMIDPAEAMKKFEALDQRYASLHASHARLLDAAKEAEKVLDPWPRLNGHAVARCIDRLSLAITKAP